jgi:hypothetical protein
VSEFHLTEHEGCKLYEFRTSRSFKTAGTPVPGSLPAATRWPHIEASALGVCIGAHTATFDKCKQLLTSRNFTQS